MMQGEPVSAGRPKRTLGENEATPQAAEKKTKPDSDVNPLETHEVRILLDARQVGSVIGRGGSNVSRIRSECSVFMSILKAPEGVQNRILTIKGVTESISLACHRIGEILLEVQRQRAEKTGEEVKPEDLTVSIKFLIHQTLVGGIIGKGGQLVQSTQQNTGARVQVSTEPLGASTEKTVTISGGLDQMYAAAQIVVSQIRDNPLRPGTQTMPYDPAMSMEPAPYYPPQGHYPPQGYPYGGQQGYPPSNYPPQQGGYPPSASSGYAQQGYPPSQYPPGSYGQYPQSGYGQPAPTNPPGAGQLSKQKIVIPAVCAGNVIGRGGTIISGIRKQSGTFISIADPEATAPRERMVTISGSPQGIQTAVMLIRQIVEQFEAPTSQQGSAAPAY